MDKNLAQDFASLYSKINADGKLDQFFQNPEAFGYSSNDFAAVMLMLKKLAKSLPSPAAARAVEALNFCEKQVDADTGPLAEDRPEWALIYKLLAALTACA
ncbi:MAG: hypothetical protein V1797_18900 [Pseudomonadota bacterium]